MLDLNKLATGNIPAITPALGQAMAEAAGVCLESQGHAPGVRLQVRGANRTGSYILRWPIITEQARQAWNYHERATELGAVGIAVMLAEPEIGYAAIRQSHRGTGFDFWLGDMSEQAFQERAILEISGIRQGNDSVVEARVREKLQQTLRSRNLSLPTYVIVIEFGRPLAEVRGDERT